MKWKANSSCQLIKCKASLISPHSKRKKMHPMAKRRSCYWFSSQRQELQLHLLHEIWTNNCIRRKWTSVVWAWHQERCFWLKTDQHHQRNRLTCWNSFLMTRSWNSATSRQNSSPMSGATTMWMVGFNQKLIVTYYYVFDKRVLKDEML